MMKYNDCSDCIYKNLCKFDNLYKLNKEIIYRFAKSDLDKFNLSYTCKNFKRSFYNEKKDT